MATCPSCHCQVHTYFVSVTQQQIANHYLGNGAVCPGSGRVVRRSF